MYMKMLTSAFGIEGAKSRLGHIHSILPHFTTNVDFVTNCCPRPLHCISSIATWSVGRLNLKKINRDDLTAGDISRSTYVARVEFRMCSRHHLFRILWLRWSDACDARLLYFLYSRQHSVVSRRFRKRKKKSVLFQTVPLIGVIFSWKCHLLPGSRQHDVILFVLQHCVADCL